MRNLKKINNKIICFLGGISFLGGCFWEPEKEEKYIPKPRPIIIKEPLIIELDFGAKLGASKVIADSGHTIIDGVIIHSLQNCKLKTHAYNEEENRYFYSTTEVDDDKYFCVVRGRIISQHARLGTLYIIDPTHWYAISSDSNKMFYYPNNWTSYAIQFKAEYYHIKAPNGVADTFYLAVFDTSKNIRLYDENDFSSPDFVDAVQKITFTNTNYAPILDSTMHFPGWE